MSQTAPSPRRPNGEYRWSRARILRFLEALVEHGSVAAACRVVGISRNSAYRLRARQGAGLADLWDEALALSPELRAARAAAELMQLAPGFFGPASSAR